MSDHPDAPRIEQANDISGLILSTTGVEQGHFIVLHDRFAIADALWDAGYRKVRLDAIKQALRAQGLDTPQEPGEHFCPHSWRCENPDRYPGYCTCVDDLADAILQALSATPPTD